ncbi:RagB/SusD family nutrient uptake outer membrane protein [Rapidithrix thailandica]|uniref:RagB/SusD family nutrient uptake outer membrane protein n=1 Tax=Rapidithrix thailandica TaxID=413964 RepID=A0AAW9S442_9BACT
MKKIQKIIIYLVISFFAFSCHNGLEPEVYNEISPSTFYKAEEDVTAAVTAMYSPFSATGWGAIFSTTQGGYPVFTEMATDVMDCQWGDGGSWSTIDEFRWLPTTNSVTSFYNRYNHISAITLTLNRMEPVEMNEELKKRYVAELKAARGWLAFMIYDLYGPFTVAPLEVLQNPQEEVIIERPTKEWMVSYIETDLKDAVSELPLSYEEQDWGRFTKGTVLMVMLKLYMHEKKWSEAVGVAEQLTAMGYELMDDYASVFTLENVRNKEIIYAVPCNENWGQMWHAHVLPYNFPTNNTNIQKWSGYRMPWSFYDTFEDEDARLEVIISEYEGTDGGHFDRDNPGAHFVKGAIPMKYGEDPAQVGANSAIDWIVFRYADVLLSLAEAKAHVAGAPDQECIDLVNQVRVRAQLDPVALADYASLEAFNDLVLLERGHELFNEGYRRQDLIRHGKFLEKAQGVPGALPESYKVLFPVPQGIINEGQGKVIQNEGY